MTSFESWSQLGLSFAIVAWLFKWGIPAFSKDIKAVSASRDKDGAEFRQLIQDLANQHSEETKRLEQSFKDAIDKVTTCSQQNLHEISERTDRLIERLLDENRSNIDRLVESLQAARR